jgi:ribosomal RNA-processing protein 9
LCLWDAQRKKPQAVVLHAHGRGNWISAVAAVPYADLIASGSCDGFVRVWQCANHGRALVPLVAIPVVRAGHVFIVIIFAFFLLSILFIVSCCGPL